MFLRRRVPEKGPLKAAVIGVGAFGRHHCAKYQSLDGVELFAVADPSADVRANAIAQYGVQAVADWRDLLGKVDLVSICTPAITHAVIVRAFLNAGAHVLVEKPIATTLKDADELIRMYRQVPADLVNIIEYNPIDAAQFRKPEEETVSAFMRHLEKNKVNARLRKSRGKDIDAAGGQLANKNKPMGL